METKTKLLIALLLAVSLITVVTALADDIYLPLLPKYPTNTPTPSPTATQTPTPTTTLTPTPTRTPTPTPGVSIVEIVYAPTNPLDEYIEIENTGNSSVDMEGWYIKTDRLGARYDFPNNFSLGSDKAVKVWTKTGTNNSSNLYWGRTEPVWNNNSDTGYLRDDNGDIVDVYSYGGLLKLP